MVRTSRKPGAFLLHSLWIVLLQSCHCSKTPVEEDCVWVGRSDIPQQDIQSIVTVKATCNEGEIQWPRPYGGLRVAFSPRNVNESPFLVCFTPQFHGINIYKESFRNLTLLRSAKSDKMDGKICMSSIGKFAMLYLEATPGRPDETAKLHYTVYTMRKKKLHRPKECKPCHYSRLVESFCHSDFVARGFIRSMYSIDDQTAQAEVVVTEMIRQRHNIFVKRNDEDSRYFGSMKLPSGCHWKESEKQTFLFTGDVKSGRGPVLSCHIEEDIWLKLHKRSILHMCGVFRKK